jgi:antitoxin HicB
MLAYPANFKKDGKFFVVSFPDIPEAITQGEGMEDAVAMAEEVLRLSMDFYFEGHRAVPAPSKKKRGQILIELPAKVSAKVVRWNERLRTTAVNSSKTSQVGSASEEMEMFDPPHPGELVQEWIEGLQTNVTQLARHIDVPRPRLAGLVKGQSAITADMALRLAAALGDRPELWMELQVKYDLWQAKHKRMPKIKRFPTAA